MRNRERSFGRVALEEWGDKYAGELSRHLTYWGLRFVEVNVFEKLGAQTIDWSLSWAVSGLVTSTGSQSDWQGNPFAKNIIETVEHALKRTHYEWWQLDSKIEVKIAATGAYLECLESLEREFAVISEPESTQNHVQSPTTLACFNQRLHVASYVTRFVP